MLCQYCSIIDFDLLYQGQELTLRPDAQLWPESIDTCDFCLLLAANVRHDSPNHNFDLYCSYIRAQPMLIRRAGLAIDDHNSSEEGEREFREEEMKFHGPLKEIDVVVPCQDGEDILRFTCYIETGEYGLAIPGNEKLSEP